jgi:hypothetical protein
MKDSFEQAFRAFQVALGSFCPYQGDNGFAERNLTHYLSMALLKAHPGSHVLFEIPVRTKRGSSMGHIDGLVISPSQLFFIEAKQLAEVKKLTELDDDLKRFEEIASDPEQFLKQFPTHQIGSRQFVYAVVADCWTKYSRESKVPKWWESLDPQLLTSPSERIAKYQRWVGSCDNPTADKSYKSYYWLGAWKVH